MRAAPAALALALFILCAALLAAGPAPGRQRQVLTKAVHVCLECIGVG